MPKSKPKSKPKRDIGDRAGIIAKLDEILQHELAGVVRYTHYSFMVFGHSRIPIVSWFRSAANETLLHAGEAGEMITMFGGHPSLGMGELLETRKHDIEEILRESIQFELEGVDLYRDLLALSEKSGSITVEEYARTKIAAEVMHISEIDKMLRRPGDIEEAVEKQTP